VTSLYFDDIYLDSYYQKVEGISERDKIRIRIYNSSKDFIRLEIKKKLEIYIKKEVVQISFDDYQRIIKENFGYPAEWVNRKNPALNTFLIAKKINMLKPVLIIDYLRTAFCDSGNTRICFDYDLRLATGSVDLFSIKNRYLNVLPEDAVIMEVKYSSYLPEHLSALLSSVRSQYASISKYELCMAKLKEVSSYA
jgi:SPX domain protein involved in polyphosphate accumulation